MKKEENTEDRSADRDHTGESKKAEKAEKGLGMGNFMDDFTKLFSQEGPKLFEEFMTKIGVDEKFVKVLTEGIQVSIGVEGEGKKEEEEKKPKEEEKKEDKSEKEEERLEKTEKKTDDRRKRILTDSISEAVKAMESYFFEDHCETLEKDLENLESSESEENPTVSGLTVNYSQLKGKYRVKLSFDVPTLSDVHRIVKILTFKLFE